MYIYYKLFYSIRNIYRYQIKLINDIIKIKDNEFLSSYRKSVRSTTSQPIIWGEQQQQQ